MMTIRKLTPADEKTVLAMMRVFYDSPALIHKSSDRVLKRDFDDCISDNPFVEGYLLEENGEPIGYSMIAKSYTTEYGGLCIWVEDLYLEHQARNKGYSVEFFRFIEQQYPEAVRFRLEVEEENERAIAAYKKNGYAICGYFSMTREIDEDL